MIALGGNGLINCLTCMMSGYIIKQQSNLPDPNFRQRSNILQSNLSYAANLQHIETYNSH